MKENFLVKRITTGGHLNMAYPYLVMSSVYESGDDLKGMQRTSFTGEPKKASKFFSYNAAQQQIVDLLKTSAFKEDLFQIEKIFCNEVETKPGDDIAF